MTRRDHTWLAGLAVAGLAVTLFQCWYVYLPPEDAALVDFCRFTRHIDCFESLHRHGHALMAWKLPVFPTLAGLFFLMASLCLFAWVARPASREAWLGTARLLSFPAAGLATFVVLSDYLVAKKTSASALAVLGLAFVLAVLTVLRGLQGVRLREGWVWTGLLALTAVLLGYFLYGAGSARREIAALLVKRDTQPAQVRWAAFAEDVPRFDAARLGNPLAEREVLLFLDLEQESSRRLAREALQLVPRYGGEVLVYLFATGDAGARLVLAQRAKKLEAFLLKPAAAQEDPAAARPVVARQEAARAQLGIETLPTAVWAKGRRSGDFTLREVLDEALRP